MSLIKMMLVMVSVAAISKTFGLLRFLLRLSFLDRKSGSAGMPRPISYAVFCLKKKKIFTCGYAAGQTIRVPVAHHDGGYIADPATLDRLEDRGLVAFRYCSSAGELADINNINGSARAIAGIFNDNRTILGLMPHPENA